MANIFLLASGICIALLFLPTIADNESLLILGILIAVVSFILGIAYLVKSSSNQSQKSECPVNKIEKKMGKEIKKRPRIPLWLRLVFSVVILAIIYQPIANQLTIWGADPVMVTLAQQASMSREGELLFLRANPQLDSDSQMKSDCPSNDGFIEQGCYNPQTNRIYIREMPRNLYNVEIVTAAHEMLHIVYIELSSSGDASLNQAIESNYSSINDPELNTQVANYAKIEPGAKDIELFSLLGTEHSNISDGLSNYYVPYFTNINIVVAYNTQILNTFKNYESQLNELKKRIDSYTNAAKIAYSNSVSWARVGNARQNDYNYNIYVADVNAANKAVDQYNQLLESYNKLVTEYNGTPPVAQIPSTQAQK